MLACKRKLFVLENQAKIDKLPKRTLAYKGMLFSMENRGKIDKLPKRTLAYRGKIFGLENWGKIYILPKSTLAYKGKICCLENRGKNGQNTGKDASLLFYLFYISVSTGVFKGTVAWDGLFAYSIMYTMVIQDLIFFCFGRIFAELSSVLSAYYPYATKYSWRILLIRLNALSVFSVQAKILLAYSETNFFCIDKTTLKSPLSPGTLKISSLRVWSIR